MLNQEPHVASEAPAGAPVLALTDNAAAKVIELAKGETNPLIGLRVYIVSGGCSGYRYGMMLDDVENPGDSVFMANGVRVYVDEKAVPLIQGSTVDYVDAMMGAGFTVENPNSVGGCGCGSSFRTADSAGQASACSH
jgi:iron-sulfur cluster assembly protein